MFFFNLNIYLAISRQGFTEIVITILPAYSQKQEEKDRAEKERVKALTLKFNERQEEEDFSAAIASVSIFEFTVPLDIAAALHIPTSTPKNLGHPSLLK